MAAVPARDPRVRDPAYLDFVARLPCVACLIETGRFNREVQVAHIRSGYPDEGWRPTGMAEKPSDARVAPLCVGHHLDGRNAQHKSNEADWWSALGVHPPELCAELRRAYESTATGYGIIAIFAGRARRERAHRG